jgi:hypothetical protein
MYAIVFKTQVSLIVSPNIPSAILRVAWLTEHLTWTFPCELSLFDRPFEQGLGYPKIGGGMPNDIQNTERDRR